jgi:hypothetical protein
MDQADWKLRHFYQHQIATIAKLTRKQTEPAALNRLNLLLNQYIDMLVVMPRPGERKSIETRAQSVSLVWQARRRNATQARQVAGNPVAASTPGAKGRIGQVDQNQPCTKLAKGRAELRAIRMLRDCSSVPRPSSCGRMA